MAEQYGFYINIDRCVQCHACEVACKVHNEIEFGIRWRKVVGIWAGQYPDLTNRTISYACMHCGEPNCAAECPALAITKRREDGIVVGDPDACIGCRLCAESCPFGAPQYGEDGKMQKCDLCVDRIVQGNQPVCVETCPGEALHFGTMQQLSELATARRGQRLTGSTQPSVLISSSEWPALESVVSWK